MSEKILCPISTLVKNLEIKAAKLTEQQPTAYCHKCKQQLNISRFYSSKGITDYFNCKDCYKAEYKRIMRETPLF